MQSQTLMIEAPKNTRFPFTQYPNGWFRVAYSDELPSGKVIPCHYFGRDLVLFRTEDNIPHLWDAYCPHLGAHLGYGGVVKNSTIQCPFHGWCFNSNGQCIEISYANKIPSTTQAQIHTWPVCEVHGLIMVYYHSQREAPNWQMPTELPGKWNRREWTPFMLYKWKIRTHVQEIMENIVDAAHFFCVHKDFISDIKDSSLEIDDVVATQRILMEYDLSLPIKNNKIEGNITSWNYGLGCTITYTKVKSILNIEYLTVVSITPIDHEYIEIYLLFSTKRFSNPLITFFLRNRGFKDSIKAIHQDSPIWENKTYFSHPLLCDGDGEIMKYRRWAQQFY